MAQFAIAAAMSAIPADSEAGMSLLSQSRLLPEEDHREINTTWMKNYSIKFLGCHHVATWNDDAEENNDVRMKVNRQVRFRLCQSSSCSSKSALGCNGGYGDYVVDMSTFMDAYLQNKQNMEYQECAQMFSKCGCGENYYGNNDKCQYNCATKNKKSQCLNEDNQYYNNYNAYGNQQQDQFDLQNYAYCTKVGEEREERDEHEGNEHRNLYYNQNYEYYLGPYCSDKGDKIHLGLFEDDTCTVFADSTAGSTTYYKTYGTEMPYYGKSLVDKTCYSCKQVDYDNEYYYAETSESCENVYIPAGKCETKVYSLYNKNKSACQYIEGIKLVKRTTNGVIYQPYHGTKAAAVFIGIFATSFVLLACYIVYLKMSIDKMISESPKKMGFFRRLSPKRLSPRKLLKKFSFNRSQGSSNKDAFLG